MKPSFMEKPKPIATLLLLLGFLCSPLPLPSAAVSDEELESAIYSLRSRGYHLFGNAIISSDVRLDLLFSNDSFTLFAPTDTALFSLDMVFSASAYVGALRHHVALGRHPLPALRALIPGTTLPTLLPSRKIRVSYRDYVDIITVDGVDVVLPGLFYGQSIAVHGLAGILTQHTKQPSDNSPRNFQSKESHYAPASSPSVLKEWRKPNKPPAIDLAPSSPHSNAPISKISYPPVLPWIPITPSYSPEASPSSVHAGGSCSIEISPAIHPVASGISGCSSTASPESFPLGYQTCCDAKDFCSPKRYAPNQSVQS